MSRAPALFPGERSSSPGKAAGSSARPLFFYSTWPLGYHNVEAERKALAFAQTGFRVVYVNSIGFRNPDLSTAGNAARLLLRKLEHRGRARRDPVRPELSTASLLVAPPRQLPFVRRLNARWVERQLRALSDRWAEAVAWVRWPAPELVDALARLRPAALVYECYDAYRHTPGVRGRWIEVFERAERALVAQADAVVVPSEPLAERFRAWGADVRLLPHGVELFDWREPAPGPSAPVTIGYAGTLDYRLDMKVLRGVAERLPGWRLRLIGPVQEGFDPAALADLPNVSVEPAVPHSRLGETLAGFDVGVMPYFDDPNYHHMCPVKNLELFAAGKPAVARPNAALMRFSGLLYFAESPEEFARELERAVRENTAERARERRAAAEANTWERRLDEMGALVEEILARSPVRATPGAKAA
jgi:glycosyltransferase involved in cell wall biosynthesis